MPFLLKEYVGFNYSVEQFEQPMPLNEALALSRFVEAAKSGVPQVNGRPALIYPQYHILSADKPTRNLTLYTTEAHKGSRGYKTGQHSFTKPYPIPVIGDHQASPECGSKPSTIYGRIVDAKLVKNLENGRGHMAGLGEITHPEAIDEILTGRWLTGSLGSSVDEAQCTICGQKFGNAGAMRDHPHERGGYYKRVKKPSVRREGTPTDGGIVVGTPVDDDWAPADASDRGAQRCMTQVNRYQAREYSRVTIPSDDESIVNVMDTATMPGSHFDRTHNPTNGTGESYYPTAALWVPMAPSSRTDIESWGSRYIDLVTGREKTAEELHLFSGTALHEHYERILGGDDRICLEESLNLSSVGVTWDTAPLQESAPIPDTLSTSAESGVLVPTPPLESPASIPDSAPTRPTKTTVGYTPVSCGENHTFTITDKLHYQIALRTLETYTGPDKREIRARILQVGRQRKFA